MVFTAAGFGNHDFLEKCRYFGNWMTSACIFLCVCTKMALFLFLVQKLPSLLLTAAAISYKEIKISI